MLLTSSGVGEATAVLIVKRRSKADISAMFARSRGSAWMTRMLAVSGE